MTPHPDLARLATLLAEQSDAVAVARAAGTLSDWLYENWYLAPDADLSDHGAMPPWSELDAVLCDITDSLSPWSDGWIVLTTDAEGGCYAGKGEEKRMATTGRYAGCSRAGLPPMPGDRVAMPDFLSWRDHDTGQWAAQSALPPEGPLIRLYVNVGPDGIGHAVHRIVEWLVDENLAFRMKCPGSVAGFARPDALVLYLAQREWPARLTGVLAWAEEIELLVRPGHPALTMPLAPGVAFAEDPGDGRSFGQHRCALIAAALAEMSEPFNDVASHVEAALTAAGVLTEEPWKCAI